MTDTVIYRVVSPAAWAEIRRDGVYHGAPHDQADGFIHFSTSGTVAGTLARHYAGQTPLILLAVPGSALGTALRWETARGGLDFPHLYAPLRLEHITEATRIEIDPATGLHRLPPGFESRESG